MTTTGVLWGRLREAIERRASRPVLTFLDAKLAPTTYDGATLLAEVMALSRRLAELDLDPNAPLGILSSSQRTQVLHFLAALAAGLVPAILTPPNRKLAMAHYLETLQGVTRRCKFAAIVSDLPEVHAAATVIEATSLRSISTHAGPRASKRPNASFLQFSSGTTGIKRAVVVPDEAVVAQIETYGDAIALGEHDVIVGWLPLYHDMGFIACLLMPLAHGVHSVMANPLDWVARPSLYLHAVTQWRGTLSWHPNFAFAFLAARVLDEECEGVDLSSLRSLFNCSEPVTAESQRRFAQRFERWGLRRDVFCGTYAMAETTFALTCGRNVDVGARDGDGVSVGRRLPGVELELVGDDGVQVPERALGEIRVRSPFGFEGYWGNPEATDAVLRDGWYSTGDLGYRIGEEIFVTGRKKDLLIVGGVNVWPQDIEELACAVEGTIAGRAVAFADFDAEQQTERVVVLVESAATEAAARRAIEIGVRQRILAALQIANFEVHVVAAGTLLKSSSGKHARARCRDAWRARR